MTLLQERMREAALRLAGIEAGNPVLEAQYLMSQALERDRVDLLRWGERDPIPFGALERFDRLLAERLERKPLQYVLGTAPFCGLEIEVGPGVLIPRSETEGLVEQVFRAVASAASDLGEIRDRKPQELQPREFRRMG